MTTGTHLSARVAAKADAGAASGPRGLGDPDTIFFGGGLPDPTAYPAAAMAQILDAAARDIGSGVLGYVYEMGDIRLRQAIAARAVAQGVALAADEIVLTNGCAGAIELVAKALVDPGDVVVAEEATYAGATKIFEQMGGVIEAAALDAQGLDLVALEAQLGAVARAGRRIKLIYTIATCQNPTASNLSLARRQAILALAERHDALVVEDYTYGDIRFAPLPPPFIALDRARAIQLGSFSKTMAPGLRTGWIAAPRDIVAGLVRGRTDLGTSPLLQRSIALFLEDGSFDSQLAAINDLYRRKRDHLVACLERHCRDHATWSVPEGGFFVWLTLRTGEAGDVLAAAQDEKVAFLPGPYFAVKPGMFASNLRLSYGEVPMERIEEGIARLGRALSRSLVRA